MRGPRASGPGPGRGSEASLPDGFDGFVIARGPALLRFAYVLSGDGHLAEDLVQEVLARSHRRWERIERMQAPEAYVRKSIVREYLSWKRRKASTERVVAAVPDWADHRDHAHDLAVRGEMWAMLSGLPRAQRAVLVLRFYADLTDEEIAAQLGCGQSTVRAHAARALAKLRTVVSRQASTEADHG